MSTDGRSTDRLALLRVPCLIALVAVLLACGVSAGPTATPTAAPTEPPTATIAPTQPPTATAVPATATPPAATASPASAATIQAAGSPAGTPLAAGPAPAFIDVRQAVLDYLQQSGGSVAGLSAALTKWGMESRAQSGESFIPREPPAVAADFDGDGQDEVAVIAEDPNSTNIVGASVVMIADSSAGQYAIAYDAATPENTTGTAAFLSIADANGDAVPDLSYTVVNCGAHTCYYEVDVIAHVGGQYANLSMGVSVPYPDLIALRDQQGDKRLEIVIHGGTIGSVGAGPQRPATFTYALGDDSYSLARTEYDPSDLLIFRVLDANAALADGHTDEAIALYRQARDDQDLKASGWMVNGMTEEQEDEALRSFARFRLVVAETIAGDAAAAQTAADDAAAAGGPYAALAEVYWTAYSAAGSVDAGCTAVTDAVVRSSEPLDILNAFGYANPFFAAADVCQGAGTPQ